VTLDEFRQEMESWWADTDARELARKRSQGVLFDLIAKYESFDSRDRSLADQVVCEWTTSTDDRKRFDALAMIDHFHIRSAIPQLRALESEIAKKRDHEAPYELAKVRRILERLVD
jgi:hypothetical protein